MKTTAKKNLLQLKDLAQVIGTENYNTSSTILSGASIGQHIRHILEFYMLLLKGVTSGSINYDNRERDNRIETDPEFAVMVIQKLLAGIDTLEEGQIIHFEADYSAYGSLDHKVVSSAGRELAYCVEHSVHHQAIIKAGIIDLKLEELVDDQFGVAYSTLRYRKGSCAQ